MQSAVLLVLKVRMKTPKPKVQRQARLERQCLEHPRKHPDCLDCQWHLLMKDL